MTQQQKKNMKHYMAKTSVVNYKERRKIMYKINGYSEKLSFAALVSAFATIGLGYSIQNNAATAINQQKVLQEDLNFLMFLAKLSNDHIPRKILVEKANSSIMRTSNNMFPIDLCDTDYQNSDESTQAIMELAPFNVSKIIEILDTTQYCSNGAWGISGSIKTRLYLTSNRGWLIMGKGPKAPYLTNFINTLRKVPTKLMGGNTYMSGFITTTTSTTMYNGATVNIFSIYVNPLAKVSSCTGVGTKNDCSFDLPAAITANELNQPLAWGDEIE